MATTSKRKLAIITELERLYPDAVAELNYTTPFELLVATMLSAQTTDVQVNKVTKNLFPIANTPEQMVELGQRKIGEYIRTIGLYKNKSKNLVLLSEKIISDFGGEVPKDRLKLETLAGVGRKTANVVLSNAFDIPAIAVDTHVFRVANRLNLVKEENVLKTELSLMKVLPKNKWTHMHHAIIYHGRRVCKSMNPLCNNCTLIELCKYEKRY